MEVDLNSTFTLHCFAMDHLFMEDLTYYFDKRNECVVSKKKQQSHETHRILQFCYQK